MKNSSRCRCVISGLFIVLLNSVSWASFADEASGLRIVVLSQTLLDGEPTDANAIETSANQALRRGDMRSISMDASLRSQSFALAESVSAGEIPDGITALNADAIWLISASCESTRVQAWGADQTVCSCTFNRRLIRDEEEVFSKADPWRGQCINSRGAMDRYVEDTLPAKLDEDVQSWRAIWSDDGTWSVDLLVSGMRDRAHARSLVERFEALPGVSSVRMGVFSRAVSRYSFRGEGLDAARNLPDHIESDSGLGLAITHQTDRLLHARIDLERVHRRKARMLVIPPAGVRPKSPGALVVEAAPELVRSAVLNIGWLEVTDIEVGAAGAAAAARNRVLRQAGKAKEPFLVVVVFRAVSTEAEKGSWLVSSTLIRAGDGQELLTGNGQNTDPMLALDSSVRDLNQSFVTAIADRTRRTQLGLPDAAKEAHRPSLRVSSLEINPLFPTRMGEYRQDGIGRLRLTNETDQTVAEARVELRAGGEVLSSMELEEISAGSVVEVAPRINAFPNVDPDSTHRLQLEVTVSFKAGESYGRVRAYAPLLVHRRNAIDWNDAATLAAFIDPTDPSVRSLATTALGLGSVSGGTRSMGRAALLFESLWHRPLNYVADPVTTSFDDSIDDVQFPAQTLERLAGDCDDMTVLLASLFESVGLATAIITTPGHVLLAVETGLLAGGQVLLNQPKERFVEVDGALFIPIEATAVGAGFLEAWRLGAELVSKAGSGARTFRTREAWRRYPSVDIESALASVELEVKEPDLEKLSSNLPTMDLPIELPEDEPVAELALSWLGGNREEARVRASDLCYEGYAEACYNLAVMLVSEGGEFGDGVESDAALPPLLFVALSLLPEPVVRMVLDHGGLGMGDDQSEASEEAVSRRNLEEVLRRVQERQKALQESGEAGRSVRIDPMGGRRGSPAAEPKALAPLFFFGQVSG